MSSPEQEPMMDVAGGDPALSRHLRDSLKVLRDASDNPEFQRLADDIIAGRQGLRAAATSDLFAQAMAPHVGQFVERYEQLSEEEREELARQGERQLAEQREVIAEERREAERRARRRDDDDDDDEGGGGFLQRGW
ncbi:hypothetical protein C1701_09250 [Actinoalloteichus sp. AHMU CJ021]|nr:hypothetical protein [Actinoalloteichus caeruleus]AUS78527.1 hypothetical protein C1701_09250 [Actinoalloteichus sp. AHMU CJ021]